MVVRVRVELRTLKGEEKSVETVALINAGFESEDPEVIVPTKLAERLGLWPQLPNGTEVETYEVAGGGKVRTYRVSGWLESRVITDEGASDGVKTVASIMEGEREVVFSDRTISAHKMILEDVENGVWRFRGEKKVKGKRESRILVAFLVEDLYEAGALLAQP